MSKKPPPSKPTGINGEHEALWNFMLHLNERIDNMNTAGLARTLAILLAVIATLVAVILK